MSDNAEQCARAAAKEIQRVILSSVPTTEILAAIIAKHFAARAEEPFDRGTGLLPKLTPAEQAINNTAVEAAKDVNRAISFVYPDAPKLEDHCIGMLIAMRFHKPRATQGEGKKHSAEVQCLKCKKTFTIHFDSWLERPMITYCSTDCAYCALD